MEGSFSYELMLLSFVMFGAVMGSFVNMAASRLPVGEDLIFKKSHCMKCNQSLQGYDLIPVLSWLILKGRCRNCGAKIGIRYLLTEVLLAAAFAAIYIKWGLSGTAFIMAIAAVTIAIIVVVDFEHYIIPDSCQIILLLLGIYYSYENQTLEASGFGFAFGLVLGLGLRWIYKRFLKKDALGLGDVKLLAVSGIWLGWFTFIPYIFYSGLLGVISGSIWMKVTGSKIFPFGPALAISLFLMVLFPELALLFWRCFNIF